MHPKPKPCYLKGLAPCKRLFLYWKYWRYLCARLIGYARVSASEQETAAQAAALKGAGCERIYREKASGGRWDRPELHRLLGQLRKGDVLVVWKLDRLSRSLPGCADNYGAVGRSQRGSAA
jgi:Resolvase, N terminal domain